MFDKKVKSYLIDALVNGIKVSVEPEEINKFCLGLVDFINADGNDLDANGDEDGILVSDLLGNPISVLKISNNIMKFTLIDADMSNKDYYAVPMARTVLGVIGFCTVWFDEDSTQFYPDTTSPIVPGNVEETFELEGDDFGIIWN